MSLDRFLRIARRRLLWLPVIGIVCLVLMSMLYATLSDRFVTSAVVTARTSEDRSFDAGSLSGLAALAGGGQRPTFEQLAFLVRSEPIILRLLPSISKTSPAFVDEMVGRSAISRTTFGIEQFARGLFGKPLKVLDRNEQFVAAIRNRLKVDKTPEGYIELNFASRSPSGQLALVAGLLREADAAIRARERIDYRTRVQTYQALVDTQARASERAVLVALIGREYSNYVAAQSGETFSFVYVERPLAPKRVYSLSLLTLSVLAAFIAIIAYIGFILFRMWAGD